jgi:anhydro-N-acetylmuramic acid kinase
VVELYVGLMSGTSVDSIDAVLVELEQPDSPRLLRALAAPWHRELRASLMALTTTGTDELHRAARLDNAVARQFAATVNELLESAGIEPNTVRAIGSHGQTVRHAPDDADPYTLQLGNPSLLAELTGITVVADFRRRDLAAGGQGAPLAPSFHAAFFHSSDEDRAVINIGGIANLTLLPASGGHITGFDTGPGNALLDGWAERHLGVPLDKGGAWAAGGRIISELLEQLLADPYFRQPPPKSTGREYFNLDWLGDAADPFAAVDVQATLAALTAHSIAAGFRSRTATAQRLLVCGGGVHNPTLMARLSDALPKVEVQSSTTLGVDPDYVEAMGFAWLAQRTLAGQPGNLPSVTGARGPRILGGIYPA